MDWAARIKQFFDFILSKPSQPPYFLLLVGLLTSFTCGMPLVVLIGQRLRYWSKTQFPNPISRWGRLQLLLPFVGTNIGVWLFIASSLEIIFGFPTVISYVVSLLLIAAINLLIWWLLGRILSRQLIHSYLAQMTEFPQQTSDVTPDGAPAPGGWVQKLLALASMATR